MKRVASSIVEVKDGTVVNYRGDYDSYLYMVNKEIDNVESERKGTSPKANDKPVANAKPKATVPKDRGHVSLSTPNRKGSHASKNIIEDDRSVKREVGQLEKTIAKLDAQKKLLNDQLMQSTEAIAAMKLHEELTKVTTELETAEMRWAELQEQLEAFE